MTRHGERQHVAYQQAYHRAERLAEALRGVRELVRRLGPNIRLDGCELLEATITYTLNPAAAQENDDA